MTKFSDLKLDPKVLSAVAEAGYEQPTPIQAGAIPPALEGRDVLGIAQTGTGKTASFTLPMITLLGRGRARARMPRSLVLCPTRELAAQVAENFDTYAKNTRLTKALLIGGVSFGEQDKLIDRGVDVLIATPGRLLDHFERGKLLLSGVQIMVVDEADRMLDMGFIPDIERIFQLTPFTRQTLFFSATMAPEIERITDTFLHSPERIEVARQATTSETIEQRLIEITPTRKDQAAKQKRELMRAVIDAEGDKLKNAIIFCNRKTDVDIVAKSLKAHGYDAAPIHGDLDQRQRMATLDGFRDGKLRFLVASDVAARGLDIPAVSHVINFDLPSHAEDYVHRIGRTGRAGRLGTAISLSTPADEKNLAGIENLVKATLPRVDAPEGFSLSAAAQQPPKERSEREGREGRGRSRGRNRGREDRAERRDEPKAATPAVAAEPKHDDKAAVAPVKAEQPARERDDRKRDDHREERRDNARDDRRDSHREGNRDTNRDERRDRDDRHHRRDRGPSLMGMGDHVPDFMRVSFRTDTLASRRKADDAAAPKLTATPVADTTVAEKAPASAAEATSDRPARKRSRRKPAADSAVVDAAPVDVVADAPVIEPVVTLTHPTPEASAETSAEPEKKPRKARAPRKPKAEAVADAPADAVTEDAPKPRRTRRKKTDAEAEPASTDAAAEPVEKPKRRRRKADAAPESSADTAPAAATPATADAGDASA
ncbi:MAG: DEAD/DEAH box helicase [Paracoccus denitrificans]|nr:MAG: DEAD/DEAH box helicase [Paracoccus denitrificans]PZO83437.1 MAG: DEAD/DEAH box helicase [Paracoccus denitrificans]